MPKIVNFTAIKDGLTNVVANLGTDRDKASHNTYTLAVRNDAELLTIYRGNWLPRKIIDVPAFDSVRRWRKWDAEKTVAALIRKEEVRLQLPQRVLAWRIASRLFGGAALYLGTGSNDPSQPITPQEIGRGGLRSVNVLTKRNLSPGPIDEDIESEYFERPKYWNVSRSPMEPQVEVHPSRLVLSFGADLPAGFIDTMGGWGDSELTSVLDAITQSDSAVANVASLIFEAKTDVVKIPDLMANIGDKKFEDNVIRRFTLAAMGKGNNGTLILDSEEDYTQKKFTFSTIPEVMDRFYQNVSGAADIPMTRLFGMSPGGMNATGDSDIRNYYDGIQSMQELDMSPAMSILDRVLIRSALGYTPRAVDYNWNSLWQETETERSEIMERKSITISNLRSANAISEKAAEQIVASEYSESGDIVGIEGIVKAHPITEGANDPKPEITGPDAIGGETAEAIADAAPRSLYVHRKLLNADDIIQWAKDQGITSTLSADDMHVTVIYSKTAVDWMKIGQSWEENVTVDEGGPRLMEQFDGGAMVLLFASNAITWRHLSMLEIGAKSDYAEFQPHVTITYNFDGDMSAIEPYTGPLVFGPEIFKEIKGS